MLSGHRTAAIVAVLIITVSGVLLINRSYRSTPIDGKHDVATCPAVRPSGSPFDMSQIEDTESTVEVAFMSDNRSVTGELLTAGIANTIRSALAVGDPVKVEVLPRTQPDVRLIFHQERTMKSAIVQWWSGTFWFRVILDDHLGRAIGLRVPYECLTPVAQAVNLSLASDCQVSPIDRKFVDIGMGRCDGAFVVADNGQLWKARDNIKVILRMPNLPEEPEFTLMSVDGRAASISPVAEHMRRGNYREFGSIVEVPSSGCWTLSVKTGGTYFAINVRVF